MSLPPKGLALILSSKAPKGPPAKDEPVEPDADDAESGGSEKQYAKLASEAIADGDHEAAADALVSMVKSCMDAYGPKE